MKKITLLIAIVGLASAGLLAGCKPQTETTTTPTPPPSSTNAPAATNAPAQ